MSAPDQDQRTLEPTPKRVEEFRKRGDVARSRDLVSAAAFMLGGWALVATSATTATNLERAARTVFAHLAELTPAEAAHALLSPLGAAAGPILVASLLGVIVAGAVQLGWPPALSSLKFDPARPFTFPGLANMKSGKALAKASLGATAKVGLVALAATWSLGDLEHRVVAAAGLAGPGVQLLDVVARLVRGAGLALMALALGDYLLERRALAARMRMTPAEMKQESRDQEGDPSIRRRRRQRMREHGRRRLKAAVAGADMVLVNPTEYAVAIRYRSDEGGAPRVVAKGRGAAAEHIRALARQAGVPIMPEPPLTRLLHKLVPEGGEIPRQLYQAVAELLAYTYRLRSRSVR